MNSKLNIKDLVLLSTTDELVERTKDSIVIMTHDTWDHHRELLPGRHNVIITNHPTVRKFENPPLYPTKGMSSWIYARDLDEALVRAGDVRALLNTSLGGECPVFVVDDNYLRYEIEHG